MAISSKLLLTLMCRYLCALSFLSTRHSRTPYYNKFSYYAEFHILSQEKISIIAGQTHVKTLSDKITESVKF